MPVHSPSDRSLQRLLPLALVPFAVVAATALLLPRPQPAEAAAPPAPPPVASAAAAVPPPAATDGLPLAREAVPVTAAAEPDFAARIDELVELGRRTAVLAQADDVDGARATDRTARERFAALLQRFDDAGERALAMLVEIRDADATAASHRRIVLQLVLAAECERRDTMARSTGDRSRSDGLVQNLLDVMPGTTLLAEVGEATLVRRQYLRAVHEPAVLGLLQLAAEGRFPRPIATALLLTLWDTLLACGERSAAELSQQALLLLGDGDPSRRTAACRQLLRDARYRDLVVAWVREKKDRAVATEVANVAASELPGAEALALLRELAPVTGRATPAYLALGFREPQAIADDYRQLLASDTDAAVRSELVTGVGMAKTPLAIEIAQLALAHDPSPDVRVQAVFALTAKRDAVLGEQALQQALDDRRIADDPVRLAAMVFALENLASAGDANAVERVAQRLRSLPLAEDSRQRLDALLARSLPGGLGGR